MTSVSLGLRLLATTVLLVVLTVLLWASATVILATVILLGAALLQLPPWENIWQPLSVAFYLTTAGLVGLAYYEFRHGSEVLLGDVDVPVTNESDDPTIHPRVERLAATLDVPAPTVAIAETDRPHALMIGFTSGSMQLVLSRGVVETCTEEELDAVIAHELAHIKHRDAVLLTILAVPISIAEGLRSKLHTLLTGGGYRTAGRGRL